MTDPGTVMLDSFAPVQFGASYRFDRLLATIRATTPAEVMPALRQIEAAVAQGRHAAGFIAYEAAAGINPDLATKRLPGGPLLWFGIFQERTTTTAAPLPAAPAGAYSVSQWRTGL